MIITITLIELTFTAVWQSMKQKQGQCAPVSPMVRFADHVRYNLLYKFKWQ